MSSFESNMSRDLIFDVVIYFNWRQRRLNPVWDCVQDCRFELRDMEDGMYCTELVRELESE